MVVGGRKYGEMSGKNTQNTSTFNDYSDKMGIIENKLLTLDIKCSKMEDINLKQYMVI